MGTKETIAPALPVRLRDAPADASSVVIATIASLTDEGTPLVDVGASGLAVPARFVFRATRERIETAIILHQPAVVLFENGDASRPLIVGFIEALDPQSQAERADTAAKPSSETGAMAPVGRQSFAMQLPNPERIPLVEADVDGKRVRVTAQDEIVLQCGSASVTLRRNGRVIIRGTYVETHSEGTNRIKGGQVRIN